MDLSHTCYTCVGDLFKLIQAITKQICPLSSNSSSKKGDILLWMAHNGRASVSTHGILVTCGILGPSMRPGAIQKVCGHEVAQEVVNFAISFETVHIVPSEWFGVVGARRELNLVGTKSGSLGVIILCRLKAVVAKRLAHKVEKLGAD